MDKFEKFTHPVNLKYFSSKGESMSDATSMKGKCTQVAEDVKSYFEALGAVRELLHFDGKDVVQVEPKVMATADINKLVGKDAQANALNGWYARAIEAKNDLLDNIRSAHYIQFLENDEKMPDQTFEEKFEEKSPQPKQYTENDILAEWSANELADYLTKEQYCATVGKLIHKKGKLYEIYNTPQNQTSKIVELASGVGRKAYPVTVTPVYNGENLTEIKNMYLAKHDEHRETEKKVNWYKAKIKNELSDRNAEAQKNYANEMAAYNRLQQEYNERRRVWATDVQNKIKALTGTCEERRQKLTKEASSLKIFIPEALRPIKTFVQDYKVTVL